MKEVLRNEIHYEKLGKICPHSRHWPLMSSAFCGDGRHRRGCIVRPNLRRLLPWNPYLRCNGGPLGTS